MEPQALVSSLKHFLKKFCPPLLVTANFANGTPYGKSPYSSSRLRSGDNGGSEYKDYSPHPDSDEDEDTESEKLLLQMLKKTLVTSDSNDILYKFALSGEFPILLVELFEQEGKKLFTEQSPDNLHLILFVLPCSETKP